jgi:hypothetical protein
MGRVELADFNLRGSRRHDAELSAGIELIRHRVSQARSSEQFEDPAAGFMIWLEPN